MADLWSCGIILYAVLFGRYPFDAQDRDYARKIVNADYEVPVDVPVNPECVDLLLRILVADPAERLSIEDIKMHPWFLRDLPRGALDMNDFYLQAPPFLEQVRLQSPPLKQLQALCHLESWSLSLTCQLQLHPVNWAHVFPHQVFSIEKMLACIPASLQSLNS